MLKLFKPKPLIDQSSADWIFAAFGWALTYFDKEEFFQRSCLVQPTNDFFPGRVDSVHAKAENIFQGTLKYAGLKHWPFQLQKPELFQDQPPQLLQLTELPRNSGETSLPALLSSQAFEQASEVELNLSYNPNQTLKPEDLSSSFAHILAQHMVLQSQQLPPGGKEYYAEGTEILAIFMGFGVMFANSAYTFRGGCGSCYNAQANRQATLSENDVIFSLALYCRLKDIPTADATRHLKKHLKSSYKQAVKQIDQQPEQLKKLLAFK